MAEGLTNREKFLRRVESLALSARPITELPIVAAPPAHHDGVMVALVPDEPEQLAVDHEEALPADDLHITLCYLGKVQDLTTFDQTRILSEARKVVDSVGQSFTTNADGVVVMGKNDDGVPATALLIQSDEVVGLYNAMAEALGYESNYPTYIPHMTMGYGTPIESAQQRVGQPISFSKVIVKFGDAIHNLPLPTAVVAAPRSVNVIDRVIDSLGRLWDEALHPRDGEGRFIKKNGAVSGKMAVPSKDRRGVNMVDAHRANVIGFRTFDNDVWVLAEIRNEDGSTSQGFARAANVKAVAPVKARLDALYPVNDERGDAFINSSLERKRQLDLILAHINSEYGPSNDSDGAIEFLETLGLWEKDLDYIYSGDDVDYLGGIQRSDHPLSDDELDEQESVIEDARSVKALRDRVHDLREDADFGFTSPDAHVPPKQQLLQGAPPDEATVEALQSGADPLSLSTDNLLGAMDATDRFERVETTTVVGGSPIEWRVDPSDPTGTTVRLAGTDRTTSDRAYFVKQSIIGAELNQTDIVNEVVASLITEQLAEKTGPDNHSVLRVPKSRFGDNPEWDGETPPESLDIDDFSKTHQPASVVSDHGGYLIPGDWITIDVEAEEIRLSKDNKDLDPDAQIAQTAEFYRDRGDIYGNETTRMVLWDFVILNGDRNPGNALLAAPAGGGEGMIVPIDHGFAFDEPGPVDDIDPSDMTTSGLFAWFMRYPITQAWLEYIWGGLDSNGNVSQATIQQTLTDFLDTYSQLDADEVLNTFRSMPGVTDAQIERATASVSGAVDRIAWMRDNMETVLTALTERRPA